MGRRGNRPAITTVRPRTRRSRLEAGDLSGGPYDQREVRGIDGCTDDLDRRPLSERLRVESGR